MTEVILDIKRWGNSLGMRLPSAIAKEANLHLDQSVRLTVEDGKIIVAPCGDVGLSLEERLSRFDQDKHAGEAMQTDGAIGVEEL